MPAMQRCEPSGTIAAHHRGRRTVSDSTRAPSLSRWGLPAIVVLVVVAFVVQGRAWAFLCDDAFISFRYARHWAEYGRLEFNLGERVEGYSNFAWVMLLGVGARLGLDPPTLAPVLTSTAMVALLLVAGALVRRLRAAGGPPRRLDAFDGLAPLLLVVSPECMVWAHGGLETAAASLAALGACLAWLAARWRTAALCAVAAAWLRIDALLPVAAFGLVWLFLPARVRPGWTGRWPWRAWGQALALFLVPVLAHLLWRHAYYGSWWPQTWAIKSAGVLLRDTYGRAYIDAWAQGMHLAVLAPCILLIRARHLLVLVPLATVLVYGYAVGGDFMAYGRFYLTATVLLAVGLAWCLADLAARLVPRWGARADAAVLAVGVLLAAGAAFDAFHRWRHDRARGEKWIAGRWEGVTAMDRFAAVGEAAGRWMRANLPAGTLVSVGAAGAVPYGSGLPTLDAYGLVDPVLVTLPNAGPRAGQGVRPGHQWFAPASYVRARDPDLLCHVGYRGPQPPPERVKPPGFERGYAWACIDVGTVEVGGEPIAGGFYCCLRPRDRALGPWGPR